MIIYRSPLLRSIRQTLCRSAYYRRQLCHLRQRYHHYQHQKGRWRWDKRVLLAFTSAAGFSFAEHGIPDERYEKSEDLSKEFENGIDADDGWEALVEEEDLKVYRRLVPGPIEMYEYKCVGTYYDITPCSFLDVQNDLDYRKEWDSNVLTLEMLQEQDEHELIRWVQKYPYPLHPREYVYARRTWVSDDCQLIVVDSEVIPTDIVPDSCSKNVRVSTYSSRMAVRSHRDLNQHGLDFILTYFDNPEANIPKAVYNWIINQGGPYFLQQVHEAACEMEETGRMLEWTREKVRQSRQRLGLPQLAEAKLAPLLKQAPVAEEDAVLEEAVVEPLSRLRRLRDYFRTYRLFSEEYLMM
ncbi:unnamed protein product [Cylicocyclus nassatus]|uniref:Phosphatidylcholine transfer protein n=1 Tax=Cylicocyclus nassatus TaxID=53992 RepID=A0AA36GIW2_CYLNA|nr:unnamed protein product [Cylicocyclus nassatus]